MSQFRSKIKNCLQIITKSIKQIPQDKQPIIANRVNKVLQKYSNQQSQQSLTKFHKQLQFNLNFIKLSYPNIKFNVQQAPKNQQNIQGQQKKQSEFVQKAFGIQFQLQNAEALKKQMKDIKGIRQEVQFSNWSQGNVDPQNLKRHKQLLTRQHFGGDFWKDKPKPKMQSAQAIASLINSKNFEPPIVTDKDLQVKQKTFVKDPLQMFEKVKR